MLVLHTSHKTEYLLEHLAKVVESHLPSPFDQEVFLIQSQGMERWLSQQLASKFGVWANAEFLFPGKFFDTMASKIDASLKTETFAREKMIWRIESLLRNLEDDEVFAPLRAYLQGEQVDTKRFQLATQIAQSFDQYQLMRPEFLHAWQSNQLATEQSSEVWQKALWLKLLANLDETERDHRGQMWQKAVSKMQSAPKEAFATQLPKRISIFGVSTMPPIFLQFIQAIALHTDVHIYLMQPCRHYWGDIAGVKETKLENITRKHFSEKRAEGSLSIAEDKLNHPLLSLLGQQGREFHQLLLEEGNVDWAVDSFENFSAVKQTTLTALQDGILDNQRAQLSFPPDESLQIVSCHSAMREVQVLKDYLLERLNADHDLELRDIVVMAPDIGNYEPYISAVFEDERFRYAIADRSIRSSNEILDALLDLLSVLSSRFEWTRVVDLLEKPVIYEQFGLDESALAWIRAWVDQTHIRWGKDAAHKKALNLPEIKENTWDTGLKQMMAGYVERGTGIDIEGSTAQIMGTLDHFVRKLLFVYVEQVSGEKTLTEWLVVLHELIDLVFKENDFKHKAKLIELVHELARLPSTETHSLAVIMQWLETSVGEQKTSQGFLAGQLTFCSMLPMRSIPFKVICMLGLNENEFPKMTRRPSFDLMSGIKNFKKGDRSSRRDDRYQFLDAILSARDALYLSYVGQSLYSNHEIPPSVVISELVECFDIPDGESLVVKHPLQAFSERYFTELTTFDASSAQMAQALTNRGNAPVWWQADLTLEYDPPTVVALADLVKFLRDPQSYFVQQVLGIRFDKPETENDTSEVFALDHLENYQVNQNLLSASLKGHLDTFTARLKASGEWMQSTFGDIRLQEQLESNAPIVGLVAETLKVAGQPVPAQFIERDIVLDGESVRLEGWTSGEYRNANVFYRAASLKAKDYLQAWVYHLLGNKTTYLIGLIDKKAERIIFEPLSRVEERNDRLAGLLKLFIEGHCKPSDFWPEVALAYMNAKEDKKDQTAFDTMDEAVLGRKNHQKPGERYSVAQEISLIVQGRDVNVFLTKAFYQSAEEVFSTMLEVSKSKPEQESTKESV